MQIYRDHSRGILGLSQKAYIDKVLSRFGMSNYMQETHTNPRLRRVIWNPWQSNGKLRNMKNRSFEVLCHKQIRNARRGSKEKSAMKKILHGCEITLLLRKCCPFATKISQPFCTVQRNFS
ncbi:hypothetical protein AAG906_007419 [Vitis piasezkii]